jgi:hypothetical protein
MMPSPPYASTMLLQPRSSFSSPASYCSFALASGVSTFTAAERPPHDQRLGHHCRYLSNRGRPVACGLSRAAAHSGLSRRSRLIRSQQAVPRKILAGPQRHTSAVVNRVDRNNDIGVRER